MPDRPRIDDLRRRVHANPASIAFAALAEEYRRAGMLDEAIATCKAGLLRHPSYLSARVTLGRALLDAGREGEAQDAFEQVLRSAPENLAAVRGLAEIHQRSAQVVEAAAVPVVTEPPPAPPPDTSTPAMAGDIAALTQLLSGVERVRRARAQSRRA